MSRPARKLDSPSGQMDVQKLESELLSLPFIVRRHLAHALLNSVQDDVQGVDEADAITGSQVSDADVESAWADEAHRRWEAYQRGEEEMLDFDAVMAEIRAGFRG
jgi:hypothetical protein